MEEKSPGEINSKGKKLLNIFVLALFSKLMILVMLIVSPTYKSDFINGILSYIIPSVILSLIVLYQLILKQIVKRIKENQSYWSIILKWGFYVFSFVMSCISYFITSNISFFLVSTIVMLFFCFRYKDVENFQLEESDEEQLAESE